MLVNVEVLRAALLTADTANPTYTVWVMLIVAVPMTVHVVPFDDPDAVNVEP